MSNRAWEYEYNWINTAIPPFAEQTNNNEADWMKYLENGNASDLQLLTDWYSEVPGSKAPCHLVIAAIECMREKGYDVAKAETFIESGLRASREKDTGAVQVITAQIYRALLNAPKDEESEYWKYKIYRTFDDVKADVSFPLARTYDVFSDDFANRVYAGWMGQLIGGCLGTQIEGYTTHNIRKQFGEIRGYLRQPETYNDDITYELAYLDGFADKGYSMMLGSKGPQQTYC